MCGRSLRSPSLPPRVCLLPPVAIATARARTGASPRRGPQRAINHCAPFSCFLIASWTVFTNVTHRGPTDPCHRFILMCSTRRREGPKRGDPPLDYILVEFSSRFESDPRLNSVLRTRECRSIIRRLSSSQERASNL